jgi:hypothetical protein
MAKSTQTAAPKAQTPAAVKAAATRATKAAEKAAAKKLEDTGEKHNVTDEQRQGERRQEQTNAIAQFAQSQMAAPAAHTPALDAEAAKLAAFNEAMKKLAAEHGINPELVLAPTKATKATKTDRLQKNGITRPASGTTTGAIWDVADEISLTHNGHPATIAEVRAHAKLLHTNDHTIKTQYARWRAFHGIKGRVQLVLAAPQPVPAADEGTEAEVALNRRATDKPADQPTA